MVLFFLGACFLGGGVLFADEQKPPETQSAPDLPSIDQRSDLGGKVFDFGKGNGFTSKSRKPKLAEGFKGRSSLSPRQKFTAFDQEISLKKFSADKSFPVGTSPLSAREQKFFRIQKKYEDSAASSFSVTRKAPQAYKKSSLKVMRYQGPEAEKFLARSDRQKESILEQTKFEEGTISTEQIREILNKD